MNHDKQLFIVGRLIGDPNATLPNWDFQGVFSTEELAEAACRDWTYFLGPVCLDEQITHETETWPGMRYPIAKASAEQ